MGWQSEEIPDEELVFAGEEATDRACSTVLQRIVITPAGGLSIRCGIGSEDFPESVVGNLHESSLVELLRRANEDLFVNWLALEGPQGIRTYLEQYFPSIRFREHYVNICHLCHDIFTRSDIRGALAEAARMKALSLSLNRAWLEAHRSELFGQPTPGAASRDQVSEWSPMQDERISLNIGAEVKKLGEVLKSASQDRKQLLRLLREPSAELARSGIVLDKYGKSPEEKEWVVRQVSTIVTAIVTGSISAKLGGIVASVSAHAHTETVSEYNFNHSAYSETAYESHVDRVRGVSSHTSTGHSSATDVGFAGPSLHGLEQVLVGPLISKVAIQQIQVAYEKMVTGVHG